MGREQKRDQLLINSVIQGLKKVREDSNLTQEDVYNDTGIHIARIETGKVNISISTLSALLTYYNKTLSNFFLSIEK
jgi:predicted transcriptional regulator